MLPMKIRSLSTAPNLAAVAAVIALTASTACAQVVVTPRHKDGIYKIGETVVWEVKSDKLAQVPYTLKRDGLTKLQEGTLDLSKGPAQVETSLDAPGAVLLEIKTGPGKGGRTLAGAMVAPEKIQPSMPRPDDFDAFWAAKIKELDKIPINPQAEAADPGKSKADYFKVTLDNIGGTHIYGQLAKPKGEGKFPAMLLLQYAGIYELPPGNVLSRAQQGWLALNIEPHDIPFDRPKAYYEQLKGSLGNYSTRGNDDREKSYFLRMYLGCYRAVEYLSQRPDWDGKTLVVLGDSMGGQQTLCTAGLNPKVTAMLALVPASCDMTGPKIGRAAGFPDWAREAIRTKNDKIYETGRYFDPVNFASKIKCPALVGMGLIDETCPPTGVWATINQISGPKEPIVLINSAHQDANGSQAGYRTRREEWLRALVKGEPAPVSPLAVKIQPDR
jgi:cephalosporin-C deacetylase-like acetyl esterase